MNFTKEEIEIMKAYEPTGGQIAKTGYGTINMESEQFKAVLAIYADKFKCKVCESCSSGMFVPIRFIYNEYWKFMELHPKPKRKRILK
jgi:hypothetical protein